MGERCRMAALGATFALLVAACAADDASRITRPSPQPVDPAANSATAEPVGTSTTPGDPGPDVDAAIVFPETLADASFVDRTTARGKCIGGDESQLSLFDSRDGTPLWEFPIPRPGGLSTHVGDIVHVSFAWDTEQPPGIGTIDLASKRPLWQHFLPETPQQLERRGDQLIVSMRSSLLSLDAHTGEILWDTSDEFAFERLLLDDTLAYVLTTVGVTGIDLQTGERIWTVPLEDADNLAAHSGFLVVTAGPRVLGIDLTEQVLRWTTNVDRLRAGEIHLTESAVVVEASPAAAPSGGRITLDRTTGAALQRIEHTSAIHIDDAGNIITTTVNPEGRPGLPYLVGAIDPVTGVPLWQSGATAPLRSSLLGASGQQIVINDPHPAISGVDRLRLLDTTTGDAIWETATIEEWDGALVELGAFVSLHRTVDTLAGDRGLAGVVFSNNRSIIVTEGDGIEQPPTLTPHGLLVISGEQANTCVGRQLGEPGRVPRVDEPA